MHVRIFAGSLALSLLASLPTAFAAEADASALALKARGVFKQFCHRCHHGEGSEGGEFDVLMEKSLTAKRDEGEKPYVVPGQPDESYVVQRMLKSEMPPEEVRERPSAAEIDLVKQWIAAGAPPYPQRDVRAFLDIKAMLTAVRDDLRKADLEDRAHFRYFTLTHLHNNRQVPDEDLRVYRAALSKAVNSLSWKPRIVLPRPVDKAETVLAVDVRDLDWDRGNLWQEVLRHYPYGLKFKDYPDDELRVLDDEITQLAGCELPLVRADWFVAAATRPPLYHTLLQLPTTATELESQLDVNVIDNFRRDRLARGGFFPSGVSGQNRLVERHEARYGAYWKSYDFKKDNDRFDLKRFPLGPHFPDNDFADQAFTHDGGESIFNLPNGLQGYLLVDGHDHRIDAGPIGVVGDSLKTAGTNEIVTGVSCMACHKHGMISFKDQIRDSAAVLGSAERKVKRLYPDAKTMNVSLAEDEAKFLAALEKAIGPFLREEASQPKPLKDFAEPVGETARLYRFAPVDLNVVACELGFQELSDPKQILLKLGERRLKDLRLGPLATGGSIDRTFWETGKGMSLMQRVARELGATPFDVGP